MLFDRIPDYSVVNAIVAMDNPVAHTDDLPHIWILAPVVRVDIIKLAEGLSKNLKLPLHRRPEQQIGGIILEQDLSRKGRNGLACI
jgi:hypothetical protein